MKYIFLIIIAATILLGCQATQPGCASSTDKDSCCANQNKDTVHAQCTGSWKFVNGICSFACEACPDDVKTCPDGSILSSNPDHNCEFAACPSKCSTAENQDKCCRTQNKSSPAPLRCPGTWHFKDGDCRYDCYQGIFQSCGVGTPCQTGQCMALAGSAYCVDDPCEFANCNANETCAVLESFPVQASCSQNIVGYNCGTVSPNYRAECCKSKINCVPRKAIVFDMKFQKCECADVRCNVTCEARQYQFFDVNSATCGCGTNVVIGVVDYAVELRFGQTAYYDEANTFVTVLEIPQDSRCPRDVQCIQAGSVSVLLGIQQADTILPVLLSQGQGGEHFAAIKGYTLLLVSVDPEPVSTFHPQWPDYKITVLLQKA